MTVDFRMWAGQEIKRLRAECERLSLEADALERALSRFAAAPVTNRSSSGGAQTSLVRQPIDQSAPQVAGRSSKYAQIFEIWQEASKKNPLSIEDMFQAATMAGHAIDRNNIRGIVFHQKKTGRVRQEGNRYVWL
jgi:hypothetical protein